MLKPGRLRQIYETAALVALINMGLLAALATYAGVTGAINAEKINQMAAVMRGERPYLIESPRVSAEAAPAQGAVPVDAAASYETPADATPPDLETVRREADRIREELRQRLALNNSILLRVTTEREEFRRERDEERKYQESLRAEQKAEGFQKQVQIFEGLAPKIAVQHLLSMADVDEAARILIQMDTRKAKKIVEAAKRGDQLGKMVTILQRVREVAPLRSGEIEDDERQAGVRP